MKMLKRTAALFFAAIIAVSAAGCNKTPNENNSQNPPSDPIAAEQEAFDKFIRDDFIQVMEEDYTSAHVYLEHPENFGVDISRLVPTIGAPLSDEQREKELASLNESKEEYDKFNRDNLTERQKDEYDIFGYLLDVNLKAYDEKFRYMGTAFEAATGLHVNLPTMIADFVLRQESDIDALISIIESIQPYVDSQLEYTKKQAEQGMLMINLDAVIEQSNKTISAGEDSSVLTSVNKNIDALKLGDKAQGYKDRVKEAFVSYFLPSFDNIVSTMTELKTAENNTKGLAHLENGKEYYEYLFAVTVGSAASVEEVAEMLGNRINGYIGELSQLINENYEQYELLATGQLTTPYDDFDSMLSDLSKAITADFPSVGEITYTAEPLDAELTQDNISAYFNIPALDSTTPRIIKVNPTNIQMNSLEVFSTLAHEGFPGHMYQIEYAYNNFSSDWRKICEANPSYTEGYANYVENYALKYLDIDDAAVRMQQLNSMINNDLTALSDIAIHYNGYSLEEFKTFLNETGLGFNNPDMLYETIRDNPAVFVRYYVGSELILQLREKAEETLGDKFDTTEFHKTILDSAGAQYSVMEAKVNKYITDKGGVIFDDAELEAA